MPGTGKSAVSLIVVSGFVLSACSSGERADGVTVTNCGSTVTYPEDPTLLVNDSNLLATTLAAGAGDSILGISNISPESSRDTVAAAFGADTVDRFTDVEDRNQLPDRVLSPAMIQAVDPDVYVSGWGFGMRPGGVTPEMLNDEGIDSYLMTESCVLDPSTGGDVVDPWEAVTTDLENIGAVAGSPEQAQRVVEDQADRLDELANAPQAEDPPSVLTIRSVGDSIRTTGAFGAPNAIVDAAGGSSQIETWDLEYVTETFALVSWSDFAGDPPDVLVFVDNDEQSFEEKIERLKGHPSSRDLPVVREERFINLPYAMMMTSALNIDAAEYLRLGLQNFGLVPESAVEPSLELPESLAGQEYFLE